MVECFILLALPCELNFKKSTARFCFLAVFCVRQDHTFGALDHYWGIMEEKINLSSS